ncbi:DHHC-type zinc finger family protein [Rhynchospora pubera]|uniref:S-acyltransferase n=1 Tax=Rhynchospora pubera TaxID=906938 RepID=A0AAV8G8I3_9POAL|nr:DHHC-type zinc finger family protein [Rhynchospora pubera]
MDSNNEEEIAEVRSDNESVKESFSQVGSESEKVGGFAKDNSTNVETQIGVDEKEKNTEYKGIQNTLWEWKSKITRRCECFPDGVPRVRVYHVWPGKNVFFFRGRMICGPDPRGFMLTLISIVVCEWIMFSYSSEVSPRIPGFVLITSLILSIIVLTNLFLAGTRDPGIIPRNEKTVLMETGTSTQSKSMSRSRSRRVNVNGIEIKVKYCRICDIFRPPRSSHCAVCDNCVDKFDHHCPWIGQCIGLRNYRQYLMFVFSAFIFFLFIFVVSAWRIMKKMSITNKSASEIIGQMPETFVLGIFSLMLVCFLGGLLVFHGYLISLNQTAHERFKQRYINSANPYNKGTIENIKEVLFAKLEPSSLNFREIVEPEWNSIAKVLSYSSERARSEDLQTKMETQSSTDHRYDEIEEIEV